jgi:hypothetical protein
LGWILLNFEDDDEHSVRLSSLSKGCLRLW